MEDSGLNSEKRELDQVESDFPLTRLFEKLCPIYMSYGMTYDEYWYGESQLCVYYRKAHELKLNRYDELLWTGGMYVYDTLCRVSPIFHAFAKSGTKPLPYVEQPYTKSIKYKETQKELTQEEKNKIQEQERLKAKIHFGNLARLLNKRFGEPKDK